MSGDPEQEYFADGMVDEIITALARFRMLFVIARNSSFTYKGRTVDIKQVGRELSVKYVLEGSVRKAGGRVRITGQLIEAASGAHLWADKLDGELNDVFNLQDRVATSVVSVVAPKIRQSELERTRTKPTESLDSYDCFLRGMAAAVQPTKWPTAEPHDWFKRACELDPGFAAAQLMLARSFQMRQSATGMPLRAEERVTVLRLAEDACQLAGSDPFVLAGAAHLFAYIGHNYDRAETMIEQAIALNPNDSTAWAQRGWIAVMCGEQVRAIESFERQLQLSPLTPGRSITLCGLAFVHYQAGAYEQGRDIAAKSVELNPDVHALCALIVNEVALGRLEEARAAARRLQLVQPDFRATDSHWTFPMRSAETRDRIVDALRASGIPE